MIWKNWKEEVTCKIKVAQTAEKQLLRLNKIARERIIKFLKKLTQREPRDIGKALKGNKEGLWRYRVGDYRLICVIEGNVEQIVVLEIGHRREVYR